MLTMIYLGGRGRARGTATSTHDERLSHSTPSWRTALS